MAKVPVRVVDIVQPVRPIDGEGHPLAMTGRTFNDGTRVSLDLGGRQVIVGSGASRPFVGLPWQDSQATS
jgi:hypothetical protein